MNKYVWFGINSLVALAICAVIIGIIILLMYKLDLKDSAFMISLIFVAVIVCLMTISCYLCTITGDLKQWCQKYPTLAIIFFTTCAAAIIATGIITYILSYGDGELTALIVGLAVCIALSSIAIKLDSDAEIRKEIAEKQRIEEQIEIGKAIQEKNNILINRIANEDYDVWYHGEITDGEIYNINNLINSDYFYDEDKRLIVINDPNIILQYDSNKITER